MERREAVSFLPRFLSGRREQGPRSRRSGCRVRGAGWWWPGGGLATSVAVGGTASSPPSRPALCRETQEVSARDLWGAGAEGRRRGGTFEEGSVSRWGFAPQKSWCCSTGAACEGRRGEQTAPRFLPGVRGRRSEGQRAGPDAGAGLAATRPGVDGARGPARPPGAEVRKGAQLARFVSLFSLLGKPTLSSPKCTPSGPSWHGGARRSQGRTPRSAAECSEAQGTASS